MSILYLLRRIESEPQGEPDEKPKVVAIVKKDDGTYEEVVNHGNRKP